MTDDPVLLKAHRLGRRHPDGERWLLDDVSLSILTGQRVVLTGPSGSGKTLLLRALAFLDPLEAGEIYWQGHSIRHRQVPSFRAKVIYLHQRAALLEATVEAALQKPFSLRIHQGQRFDRELAVRLLEQLGRDRTFLAKQARDLSGGEIQITALVRAIQLDPHILLLDEPTAALDAATARSAERLMEQWVGESPDRRAYIWVSHDASQAERVGQTRLQIHGGKLVPG